MITPGQEAQLKTWAEERDAILGELTPLRTEQSALLLKNAELGEANRVLLGKISENKGKIELMEEHEEERSFLISQDLAALLVRRDKAESEAEKFEQRAHTAKFQEQEALARLAQLKPVLDALTKHVAKVPEIIDAMGESMKKSTDAISREVSAFREAKKEE